MLRIVCVVSGPAPVGPAASLSRKIVALEQVVVELSASGEIPPDNPNPEGNRDFNATRTFYWTATRRSK